MTETKNDPVTRHVGVIDDDRYAIVTTIDRTNGICVASTPALNDSWNGNGSFSNAISNTIWTEIVSAIVTVNVIDAIVICKKFIK